MPSEKIALIPWHALAQDDALAKLDASIEGLTAAEAGRRLESFGPNRLPSAPGRPAWLRLAAQFHNILIYILIVAAVLAFALGHLIDGAVIAAVVLVNALIGFIQEGRAEKAMEAIGRMLALKARVRRDGDWQMIAAEDLVPGDIVQLKFGDKVPADLRVLEAHGLRVDQAPLTGESIPVSKTPAAVEEEAELADRRSMAYSGCMVSGGQATAVVTVTGTETQLGRISTLLEEVESLTTPLIRQINQFGWLLSLVIVAAGTAMVTLGFFLHGLPLSEGFLAGVALVVAAIPEGLPAIITITLAVGIRRMAGRNAVIRKLPAVETLGSVTVICSDKTGTLTRNELLARRLVLGRETVELGDPADDSSKQPSGDAPVPKPSDAHRALVEAAVLCNDAEPGSGQGDPLERALLELAGPAGLDVGQIRKDAPRRAMLPFSSDLKYMATLHPGRLCLKGAPEKLLALCTTQRASDGPEPLDAGFWERQLDELANAGLRLLAVADREFGAERSELDAADIPVDCCFLGLVAFFDPLRKQVPEAIDSCRDAGIRVKMITGDHAATARAIGATLRLSEDDRVLSGAELEAMSDAELAGQVDAVHIYARTTPEHKLRLVQALQAGGQVVAMTGDGANDAPALKRADIGVAMGIKGTEASRQAAEMVLSDDNFATIVAGVEEGRGVYDNIRKAMMFILPTNGAEAVVILLAVLAGLALPLTPVQILWINMATAVTLALALAFEPLEADAMKHPPRDPKEALITPFMLWRILWVAAVLTVAVFGLFSWSLAAQGDEVLARTLALNALVAGEAVYLFNSRRWLTPSWTLEALFANPWAWVSVLALAGLQAGLTYLPWAQFVFGTTALSAGDWLPIAAVALGLFVLVEIEKAVVRRIRPLKTGPGQASPGLS